MTRYQGKIGNNSIYFALYFKNVIVYEPNVNNLMLLKFLANKNIKILNYTLSN